MGVTRLPLFCSGDEMVRATWFTDPACPWSWAAEPVRLGLEREAGDQVRWEVAMSGLWREFGAPAGMALEWLDAAAASGMPVDVRGWLQAPPRSSHPACLAVCAAAEQGDPTSYLRALRIGFAVTRRRLDSADPFVEVAREVGLDVDRFRIDLGSHAILERFGAQLERGRELTAGRAPRLPALLIEAPDAEPVFVEAIRAPNDGSAALIAAGVSPASPAPMPLEWVLERYGPAAVPEVAVLSGLPGPRAAAALWQAALQWRAQPVHAGPGGALWEPASP